jgi:TatD DNase family protein
LEIAADVGKPVIIHCRDANDDVVDVLSEWVAGGHFQHSPLAQREFAGVLHAFPGDAEMARKAYEWGFAISLGGPVTFRNAHALHALVPHLRLDRLMLETDAPYLTPHPFRGQRNEPAYVALVCHQLASLLGVSEESVAQATTSVAARFFALENVLFGHVPDHNNTSHSTLGAATAR